MNRALVFIFLFLTMCKAPGVSTQSQYLQSSSAGTEVFFYMALGQSSNPADQEQYRIYATLTKSIEVHSVKFCPGSVAECLAGSIKDVPVKTFQTKTISGLVSSDYIRLSKGTFFTVLGKDQKGKVVTQTISLDDNVSESGREGTSNSDNLGRRGESGNINNVPQNNGGCYKANQFVCDIELAITRFTNDYRGTDHQRLNYHNKLAFTARNWSEKQAKNGNISHDGFPSAREQDYQREFNEGAGSLIMAENVAMSYAGGGSAEDVARDLTDMWWNSEGHRENMLGDYDSIGVGVYISSEGAVFGTQIFGSQ